MLCTTGDREGLLENPKRLPVCDDLMGDPTLARDGTLVQTRRATATTSSHTRMRSPQNHPWAPQGRGPGEKYQVKQQNVQY